MRLIDADALIEKFNEKCDMATVLVDEKTAERFHTFCVLADAVEDAPTVDAEPVRHGHWIDSEWGWPDKTVNCNACGYKNDKGEKSNYCPNCVAKMLGGSDEE